jgi:hypothetical protein
MNLHYILVNKETRRVLGGGSMQRAAFAAMQATLAPDVEAVPDVQLPPVSDNWHHWRDGKFVESTEPIIPPPNWILRRFREYPQIGDQLDALWKTMQFSPGTPAYDMQQKILAVKVKHPKPVDNSG